MSKGSSDPSKKAKFAAVRTAIKQLEKSTKKEGIVQILGEKPMAAIEWSSTGSLMFDIALGGGLPKGRIVEFFGGESSGKTLCATRAMAEVQKKGGVAALIDAEHAFDPTFAKKLGLDPDELIVSQPEHMQDAFTVMDALIDSGGVDIIVLDSVAALVPQEELEGEVGKQTIGLVARYMSQFLRRITGKCSDKGVTIICINQVRDAIGVMYGDPTTTPGGKALKFYSSVRVQVARAGGSNIVAKQGGEDVTVGHTIRATVKKNKVAMPYRKAEFVIYYDGRPVDKVDELASVALLKGLIPKYDSAGNLSETGRTYKFTFQDEEMIAKKKDDVAVELKKYPKIQAKLLQMIRDGIEVEPQSQRDLESDMSEDEFEEMIVKEAQALKKGKKPSTNEEAEETSWDSI